MILRRRIDPNARRTAVRIGMGRTAIGIGALLATGPTLRFMGFPAPEAGGRALARMVGARDLALGVLALANRDEPRGLARATLAGAAVDAADALALGIAGGRDERVRPAGVMGVLLGGGSALLGAHAWSRMR